jgi:hypothetical protein
MLERDGYYPIVRQTNRPAEVDHSGNASQKQRKLEDIDHKRLRPESYCGKDREIMALDAKNRLEAGVALTLSALHEVSFVSE